MQCGYARCTVSSTVRVEPDRSLEILTSQLVMP